MSAHIFNTFETYYISKYRNYGIKENLHTVSEAIECHDDYFNKK